jgi:hypothetical protein
VRFRWRDLGCVVPFVLVAAVGGLLLADVLSAGVFRVVALYAIASSSGVFVAVYGLIAPWWRSPEGRTQMGWGAVIFALFIYYLTTLWFGYYGGRELVSFIAYSAVFLMFCRQTTLVILGQLRLLPPFPWAPPTAEHHPNRRRDDPRDEPED